MRGPVLALCFVALSLAWLIFFGAGVRLADWNATLLFLGATALFYWTFRTGQRPPRIPRWHALVLWALPVYAAFQLLPLPLFLLEFFSPTRALITQSLGAVLPQIAHAPISVAPESALLGLFSLLAYLTTYSLLRDMGWRFIETDPWAPVTPIVAIAALEAVISLGQWANSPASLGVLGTFENPQHFAGLLEIAFPFTLVFGFISLRRHQTQDQPSMRPALFAASAWGTSLLILLALFRASFQPSFFIAGASLLVLLALTVIPRLKTKKLRRYGAGLAIAAAVSTFLIIAPPADFPASLATLGSDDKPETRLLVWSNSASLFGDYRWFGTGLGGFESTYPKYQGSASLGKVQNPANDVLALLISFGLVGFAIVLTALAGVLRPAILGSLYLTDEPRRLLAAAIVSSLCAALLRCGVDSSLSVPAIALTFAWLAGLSQSSGLD